MSEGVGSAHACGRAEGPGSRSVSSAVVDLLEALRLTGARHERGGAFAGASTRLPEHRAFGGQIVAQAVIAASMTVRPSAVLHSLHTYFVRAGDPRREIHFDVRSLRDGRSFHSREVEVTQDGDVIAAMHSSFQVPEPGLDHQAAMPVRPGPAGLEAYFPFAAGDDVSVPPGAVEIRRCPLDSSDSASRTSALWMRITSPLPDTPLLHQALLAYLSDFGMLHGALRSHGIELPGTRSASLDHSLWLHRRGRADGWLLYETSSPAAAHGRAIGFGRLFNSSGELLATSAQEMVIRVQRAPG